MDESKNPQPAPAALSFTDLHTVGAGEPGPVTQTERGGWAARWLTGSSHKIREAAGSLLCRRTCCKGLTHGHFGQALKLCSHAARERSRHLGLGGGTRGTAAPQTPEPGRSRDANLCPAPCTSIGIAAMPPCLWEMCALCLCCRQHAPPAAEPRDQAGEGSSSFPLPLWQTSQISWMRTCERQGRAGIRLKTQSHQDHLQVGD